MNTLKIKGIIELGKTCFSTISLQQRIRKSHIQAQLLLKMMYHLLICIFFNKKVIHELNFRKYNIKQFNLDNIYIRSDEDSPDVFIDQNNISDNPETNLFKLFINILKQIGINPLDIKKMKDEKQCTLLLQELLKIKKKDQVSLLKEVYGLKFGKPIYDQNGVLVIIAKTPYYIDSSGQNEIAIKAKQDETDFKIRSEIDTLIDLQIQKSKNLQPGQQKKFSQLFCYSFSPISQKVIFQEKYGCTLETFIENQKGKLSKKDKILLCRKMADALACLHKEKIIHRDIKPQNIMVTRINKNEADTVQNLQCTIIDFDASKGKDEQQEEFFQSTVAYRPPEGLEGNTYAESYDICQLGLTFLFIVQEEALNSYSYQKRPYPREKYEKVIGNALDNVRVVCSELYQTIQEMLKYEPNQRISLLQVFSRLGEKLQN